MQTKQQVNISFMCTDVLHIYDIKLTEKLKTTVMKKRCISKISFYLVQEVNLIQCSYFFLEREKSECIVMFCPDLQCQHLLL